MTLSQGVEVITGVIMAATTTGGRATTTDIPDITATDTTIIRTGIEATTTAAISAGQVERQRKG